MKARHGVTLLVFLLGAILVGGIFVRLREGGESGTPAANDVDSVRAAVRSTAASAAFATEVAVPVEGARVSRDTFIMWIEASGRAAALRSAPLHAEVEGPAVEVPVREGEVVASGALVARVDPAPYRLAVRKAQAEVDKAKAEFQNLTLFDEEITDAGVRAERERQAQIRSGLTAAEASLEEARYELAKTEIRAPFAGRVANLAVVEGSRLRQGDSVVTILDLSRVDVDAEVLETELPYLAVGRKAEVTFPALPGDNFGGRVVTMNPLVDSEKNTARVTVRLSNPGARIVPGMHGNVRIAGRLLADRTFVPKEAIVERDRRQVVFLFAPDQPGSRTGRAKWTYVTTGLENDRFVEIVPGDGTDMLAPGQIVLVDGHATLTHDARVRMENMSSLAKSEAGGGGAP